MNRRSFGKGIVGALVLSQLGTKLSEAASNEELTLTEEWEVTSDGLEAFKTTITAFGSDDEALEALQEVRDNLRGGEVSDRETGAETFGDESFLVEFNNNGYLLVYEANVVISNLLYEFRWETAHYGGARDGHSIFTKTIKRCDPKETYEVSDLEALMPTDEELGKFGLFEPVS